LFPLSVSKCFPYSRDTILHIKDKKDLFQRFYDSLKPGGTVLITDYCHGDKPYYSQAFNEYVKSRGYNLLTVPEYGKVLESVGFIDVEAKDITNPYFIGVLKREMSDFTAKKADIIKEFSQKDYDYIINGWNDKVKRCTDGDQVWGYFLAKKPYAWINKNPES